MPNDRGPPVHYTKEQKARIDRYLEWSWCVPTLDAHRATTAKLNAVLKRLGYGS